MYLFFFVISASVDIVCQYDAHSAANQLQKYEFLFLYNV